MLRNGLRATVLEIWDSEPSAFPLPLSSNVESAQPVDHLLSTRTFEICLATFANRPLPYCPFLISLQQQTDFRGYAASATCGACNTWSPGTFEMVSAQTFHGKKAQGSRKKWNFHVQNVLRMCLYLPCVEIIKICGLDFQIRRITIRITNRDCVSVQWKLTRIQ